MDDGTDARSEGREGVVRAESDPDWELLARAAGGDAPAFGRLVERHQERVFRLCRRLLQDPEEARDAAQEVFLKLYRRAAHYRPRGELFTLLYRVSVNHCLNQLRRRKLVRFVPLPGAREETEPAEGGALCGEPADGGPTPAAVLEARRRWLAVRRQIDRLPPTQRVVVLLTKLEGLSYKEVASTLGITLGAVESRLFRAMRTLERAQETHASGVSRGEEE